MGKIFALLLFSWLPILATAQSNDTVPNNPIKIISIKTAQNIKDTAQNNSIKIIGLKNTQDIYVIYYDSLKQIRDTVWRMPSRRVSVSNLMVEENACSFLHREGTHNMYLLYIKENNKWSSPVGDVLPMTSGLCNDSRTSIDVYTIDVVDCRKNITTRHKYHKNGTKSTQIVTGN